MLIIKKFTQKTMVQLNGNSALLDNTVTFLADGNTYEIVSVKSGNSVNAPATTPTSENGVLVGWSLNGEKVDFPYSPSKNVLLNAMFSSIIDNFYKMNGISMEEYPDFILNVMSSTVEIWVAHKDAFTVSGTNIYTKVDNPNYYHVSKSVSEMVSVEKAFQLLTPTTPTTLTVKTTRLNQTFNSLRTFYTNTGLSSTTGTWYSYGV